MRMTALVLAIAVTAAAQDADSEAERLYREAWWQETGAGALDKALEGYRKAADAEGPASIRARSLYQAAVVLHRVARTEEAIRTLERLSKEFPGEPEVLRLAKARLEEWTAVDLRTSFAEWYRRYVFSPEFQAKVVDLVLKLGTLNDPEAHPVKLELLTIGEAAVPALEEGLEGANALLRSRAILLLFQMSIVPSAKALLADTSWTLQPSHWETILRAEAPVRERLRAEATGESELARAIRATASGRREAFAALSAMKSVGFRAAFADAVWDPADAAMRKAVLDRFLTAEDASLEASRIAHWFSEDPEVTLEKLVRWATEARFVGSRAVAARWAGSRLKPEDEGALDALLALAAKEDATKPEAPLLSAVLEVLGAHPAVSSLRWTPARVRPILQVAQRLEPERASWGAAPMPDPREGRCEGAFALLGSLKAGDPGRAALADLLLEDPLATLAVDRERDAMTLDLATAERYRTPARYFAQAPEWPGVLVTRALGLWEKWTDPQRLAYLAVLGKDRSFANLAKNAGSEKLLATLCARETAPDLRVALFALLRPASVTPVLRALDYSRPDDAFALLGRLTPARVDDESVAVLRDLIRREETRRGAIELIGTWDVRRFPAFRPEALTLLDSPDPAVRGWAIDVVVSWDSFDASPHLARILKDPVESRRQAAATALARVGREDAIPALLEALEDGSPSVRQAALQALEAIRRVQQVKTEWKLREAGLAPK